MSDGDKAFVGSIPEIYDDLLVPLIFETYADDLARRVADSQPRRVLEIAAGSGVVTRALAPLLSDGASYTVTDLNKPMLDHAAGRQGHDDRLTWEVADALDLPFPDETFDAVVCQFGVMFFPDRIAGYREARRVLAAGGRLFFNVWDRIEENHFADIVTETASALFPGDPPRFMARIPHGYHDTGRIRSELSDAGFASAEIETLARESRAPKAEVPAIAYCQGTPLRNEIEARAPDLLDAVTDAAARAIADVCGPGPVTGKIQAHVVTAAFTP